MVDQVINQSYVTTDPYSRYATEASDSDLAIIFKILLERKKMILFFCLGAIILASFYALRLEVKYDATAKVMLHSSNIGKRNDILQNLLTTGRLNQGDFLSQIQIMQSPEVLSNLAIDMELYKDPEFAGSLDFTDFESVPPKRQRAIIGRIKSTITIAPLPATSIVDITIQTSDPVKSAAMANALARVYGETEENNAKIQAEKATQWLADRLEVLREDVRKAEMELEFVREENNLTLSQSSDARLTKIELLTRELSKAEGEFAQTLATIESIDAAKSENKRFDTIPQFSDDRLMENLKTAEAALLRKKAVLEERYGPNHPEMIAFRAEFRAFQDKIAEEVDNYVDTLRNQIDVSKRKIVEIEKKISEYRQSYQGDSERRLKIKNLQTQANTSRTLLNNFLASYLESLQSLNIEKTPIRIIAEAVPPTRSTVSNKILIVILSGITGLFLGMFLALVMERLQDTIYSPQQIEKLLLFPVYVSLPIVKLLKGDNAADYLLANPASALAELLRSLLTAINLRDPHRKSGGRVMTVTSTHADEGKTTVSIWLATTAAQAGKKVIVVDADMRRPSLHKGYGLGNAKGLVDYLSDRLPLDEVIYTKHSSGAHVMTSKAIPTHALTLLGSERMETMIRRLRDMYDLVIIDVPTSYIFSDARVMAKLSDKTLYVVEWKKTKRDDLKTAVKQFTDMNYHDLSFVLNKIADKKIANFSSSDMAYLNYMGKK